MKWLLKNGKMLNKIGILLFITCFIISCVNLHNVAYSDKSNNIFIDRKRLDSIFSESPDSLFIDIHKSDGTFITNINRHITVSPILINNLKREYGFSENGPVIEGILAHEYGHIKQIEYSLDVFNSNPIAFKEFQADFMAGFYVANKYKYTVIKKSDPDDEEIFIEICQLLNDRKKNPEAYLMIAMLMNNKYERDKSDNMVKLQYGFSPDTVQMMRFASVWDGFKSSKIQNTQDLYYESFKKTTDRLKKPGDDEFTNVFFIIGSDILVKILKGELQSNEAIEAMIARISKVPGIPSDKKWGYFSLLARIKKSCP